MYDSAHSSDCIEQSEPAMQHCFSYQIECGYDNDLSIPDLPKANQWHKDDVAQTTRSDRLPRCNDRRVERCYDDRDRCHDYRLESSRAEQFRRRRLDNVIRRRSDILTKAKYLYYICIEYNFLQLFSPSFRHAPPIIISPVIFHN